MSGKQEGVILFHKAEFPFIENGILSEMVNLIKITHRIAGKHTTISQSGDSGALVTRKGDGKPIGIVVGGNSEYTFAISLKEIFDTLNIEPV